MALAAVAALLALVLAFFPWDLLRGPLNRFVSQQTGRHFEITRRLDVKPGLTTLVLADGIAFANPEWAHDANLVKAESARISIRLLPLLAGRIELPLVVLRKPELGLQIEPDGRRTWALARDTSDARAVPHIGALEVDEGRLHFLDRRHGADIRTEFAIDPRADGALPLSFKARGTWQKQPFVADGRSAGVLQLGDASGTPLALQVSVTAGATSLRASGTVARLASFDGADASFSLKGRNLADLYHLVGVVLPATPRYALRGQLSRHGAVWRVAGIDGSLGQSDLIGELAYDMSRPVPLLTGKVQSRALDFDDLAPLVGLPEQPRGAPAPASPPRDPARKVLPTAPLDLARLKAMNADVWYSAARVTHARQLPLDRMAAHVVLTDGSLRLAPLDLGVAGGQLKGSLVINGNSSPAGVQVHLDATALLLNQLLPGVPSTQSGWGRLGGKLDLQGRGNSAAAMLGTASGDVALLMGKGQISNILLEYLGLDGGEIIKFMLRGDRTVELRCAAAAFEVKQGRMISRVILLDTVDTVIHGSGTVSLANETLDLTLKPQPKDQSILSLRSPLRIGGTFAAPTAGPDKGALAGRVGLALALGVINPLLALAATVETGPGRDADCAALLREAAVPAAVAPVAARGTK